MRAADLLVLALENLGRRKTRTILTVSGVVIGIAALVLMVSLGIGLKLQIVKLFETDFMMHSIKVSKGGETKLIPFQFNGSLLTPDDLVAIAAVDGVESVTPNLNLVLNMVTDEHSPDA